MIATTAREATLPLMMGVPDNRQITVGANPRGALTYNFLGNSRIGTNLAPAFKQRLLRVFFGPQMPIRISPALREAPMINAIGDPDISSIALRMLDEHLHSGGAVCFNHPSAVLGSGRDGVAEKLAAIPRVWMPRTIRLRIDEPADLVLAAKKKGLHWPLILRVAGTHRGSATAKIDNATQIKDGLRGMAWGGHDLYLTEFVECRDADGHYRKLRIVVVGGEIFLRHLVIADDWLVHVHDRLLGHLEEETATLRDFRTDLLPKIRGGVLAITEAMDMDYFGVDCNVRPDGRLLIFEVNAMMDILNNTMASPNCWDEPIARIHDALAALLFDPARWRHAPNATTSA